jgi:hypothetical protein
MALFKRPDEYAETQEGGGVAVAEPETPAANVRISANPFSEQIAALDAEEADVGRLETERQTLEAKRADVIQRLAGVPGKIGALENP